MVPERPIQSMCNYNSWQFPRIVSLRRRAWLVVARAAAVCCSGCAVVAQTFARRRNQDGGEAVGADAMSSSSIVVIFRLVCGCGCWAAHSRCAWMTAFWRPLQLHPRACTRRDVRMRRWRWGRGGETGWIRIPGSFPRFFFYFLRRNSSDAIDTRRTAATICRTRYAILDCIAYPRFQNSGLLIRGFWPGADWLFKSPLAISIGIPAPSEVA